MDKIIEFSEVIETKYLPKEYKFSIIYICKQSKSIRFLCPNKNCMKLVILPTKVGNYDSWLITSKKKMFKPRGKISLYPSVWNLKHKDKCHYWIKNNQILWVN